MKKLISVFLLMSIFLINFNAHVFSSYRQQYDDTIIFYEYATNVKFNSTGEKIAVKGTNLIIIYDSALHILFELQNITSRTYLGFPDESRNAVGIDWKDNENMLVVPFLSLKYGAWIHPRIWDISTGVPLASVIDEGYIGAQITDIDWAKTNNIIAVSGTRPTFQSGESKWLIYTLNLEANDFLGSFIPFATSEFEIHDVEWSPQDSWLLAAGYENGVIKIWDTSNPDILQTNENEYAEGNFVVTYEGHRQSVNSIEWSPDGQLLAAASTDKSISIWNTQSNTQVSTITTDSGVNAISWDSEGKYIASAGEDMQVHIWEVATGQEIAALTGHRGTIHALDWSPNDMQIVSASADNTVRVWDVTTLPRNNN